MIAVLSLVWCADKDETWIDILVVYLCTQK